MEPRAAEKEEEVEDEVEEESQDGEGEAGESWAGGFLAGRQRVSQPGIAIKSRGSRSSSAPHLSGRHAITGFVYMGLCTAGNPGETGERAAVHVMCI